MTTMLLLTVCLSILLAAPVASCNRGHEGYNGDRVYSEDADDTTCGYKSCDLGKPNMLNVHLVPHTHDDVGWLKTVDQYFYGSRKSLQNAGVQYIIDSVIKELREDPNKKFIYVEVAFFYRWWRQQDDSLRHVVKRLVQEGRLEFILGGWSMNDEATTHYTAIIDQHTLGLKFLKDNFGDCGRPKVAWQIDPFGHSKEQASIFAEIGYDGLFFARLDERDRKLRKKMKTMEMIWKGSQSLGKSSDLFTGVFFSLYTPPPGFCFDVLCGDDPVRDDPRLRDYNVKELVDKFIGVATFYAAAYKTNHVMFTMGSDFQYQAAGIWYKNLDKLIKYVNERQSSGYKVNAMYSTPSCYLYGLNKAGKTWPTKSDDFFPYASDPHSFWTGYFTSRPSLKGYVRMTNNFLQAVKQLDVLAQLEVHHGSDKKLFILKEAMGVAQHHDAVSGTEKQHVAFDYETRLANGTSEAEEVASHALKKLMSKSTVLPPDFTFCTLKNISTCNITTDSKQFQIVVYNPLARAVNAWIKVPVYGKSYKIVGPNGTIVGMTVPVTSTTKRIPERGYSNANYDLIFNDTLPALGFSTYFVQMSKADGTTLKWKQGFDVLTSLPTFGDSPVLENEHVRVMFHPTTGRISGMTNLKTGLSINLDMSLMYYHSYKGNNTSPQFRASGAYIFRPNGNEPKPFPSTVRNKVIMGHNVKEVHQTFSPWASQVVRMYGGEKYVELEWTVGPIPVDDKIGKEVIAYFKTGLKNNKIYYTDANGRQMMKRVRNFRETWNFTQTEPVSGNYYPINSRIFIRDEVGKAAQFTVLTDRSLGGGSIKDGDVEIMLHRRILNDDNFGVGEPLNELGADNKGLIVRGRLYLVLDTISESTKLHRDLAQRIFSQPMLAFSNSTLTRDQWSEKFHLTWSGVKTSLPSNVNLLTLEQLDGRTFLLRLEHTFEKGEDPVLSKPAILSLKNVFTNFEIQSVDELTLAANQKKADAVKLKWNYKDDKEVLGEEESRDLDDDDLTVTLNPMQIRTFQVTFKVKSD